MPCEIFFDESHRTIQSVFSKRHFKRIGWDATNENFESHGIAFLVFAMCRFDSIIIIYKCLNRSSFCEGLSSAEQVQNISTLLRLIFSTYWLFAKYVPWQSANGAIKNAKKLKETIFCIVNSNVSARSWQGRPAVYLLLVNNDPCSKLRSYLQLVTIVKVKARIE